MTVFLHLMKRLCDRLSHLVMAFNCFLLLSMVVVSGWQVWSRYVLKDPVTWSEQICLLVIVYLVFFGSAMCVRDRYHLQLVFFKNLFPTWCKEWMDILSSVCVGVFGGYLIYAGIQLMKATWHYPLPALPLSTGIVYLPLCGSGLLTCLYSLENILEIGLATQRQLQEQL